MSFNLAGLKTYTLSASISSTQTSITLSSFKVPVSGDDVTMALLNTSIVYGTIDPKTSSSEFISFTGITQNADGTATLTGVTRGLNKTDPFTEDSDFKLPHSGAAEFICSNPPQVYNQFASPLNANTWTATQTFTGAVLVPTATSSDLGNAASIEFVVDTYTAGGVDASTTVKGLSKLSSAPASPTNPIAVGDNDTRVPTQSENDALAGTSGTPSSTNPYVTDSDTRFTFGGLGTDGALTITSGVTTIDLGGAALFRKDYTSISITGTGSLAFTNPHANGTLIKLFSRGNVTLTSSATPMINASGLGSAGTTGGAGRTTTGGGNTASTPGNPSLILDTTTHGGVTSTAGVAITNLYQFYSTSTDALEYKVLVVVPGIGGTGGQSGELVTSASGTSGAGGNGGNGGGGLYIECGGAWNFTTTNGISVAGKNGTNGGNATVVSGNLGGGGGGAGGNGGMFLALYRTLTANTGTINVAGGTPGTGGTGSGGSGGSGGASGGTINLAGNAGVAGSGGGVAGAGATGKNGFSLVSINKYN